jgi:hypothetical protein
MGLLEERQRGDKERMLEALRKTYGIVSDAVKIAGIGRRTHYEWLHSDEEYRKAVQDIREVAKDFVESKLFECIQEKDITAIIFYLKTQAKDRGYADRELADNINIGEIKVQVVYVDGNQDNKSILSSE